jgi:hypothetical protein
MSTEEKKELIDTIRKNILLQARYFLKEAQEFHPFGGVVDSANAQRTLGVSGTDEFPDANDVIDSLTTELRAGIIDGRYKIGAIGIDIYIPLKDNTGKVTALEIRVFDLNGMVAKYRYPYFIHSAENIEFYDVIIVEENF